VIGSLFADYVRMIRANKDVDWSNILEPEDAAFVARKIAPAEWYPMEVFERLGNAILREIAKGDVQAVRFFGHIQVEQLRALQPRLVARHDPVETMMRFRVFRATFFDFDALDIPTLNDHEAVIVVRYHMGKMAEEAASWQTLGFFERLVEVAGGTAIEARFIERSWAGDARTAIRLRWTPPPPP